MSDSFEWQKQQANERVQSALQDAAAHRFGRERSRSGSFRALSFKTVLLLIAAWFLIGLLLSGCSPTEPAYAENADSDASASSGIPPAMTMADRLRFQDRLWEQALASGELKPAKAMPAWTMAERIRFHDRIWDQPYSSDRTIGHISQEIQAWSMADRIRFQDRLEERSVSK